MLFVRNIDGLAELVARLDGLIRTAGREELLGLLALLEGRRAIVRERLREPRHQHKRGPPVTPSEAARLTGLPRRWFYDHPNHPAIIRPSPGRILVDLEKLNMG